jgi:hypothetical protein
MMEGKESYAADALAVDEIVLRPSFHGNVGEATQSASLL